MVLNALDMLSSRLPRSLARFDRPCAVKKLTGLSSALLTRLPVASLVCVAVINSDVFCNCRRFERTPAERTMSAMVGVLPVLSPRGVVPDPYWIVGHTLRAAVMRP